MKHFVKSAALMMGLLMIVGFTSCGKSSKKDPEPTIVGNWKLTKLSAPIEGMPMTLDLTQSNPMMSIDITVNFKSDDTFIMKGSISMMGNAETMDGDGTYELKGDKLTLTAEGEDSDFESLTCDVKSLTSKEMVLELDITELMGEGEEEFIAPAADETESGIATLTLTRI